MARTASNMLPLNTKAFDFSLLNTVNNKLEKLNSLKGEKGTIIMFICNHCPFVIHVNPELVNIANNYQQKGIGFIAINSNDVENYPQDGPELMTQHAKDNKYPFSYLYDETQEVAKAYKAACTPDFFLFNENLELVYRGQLDDSRPGNDKPLNGKDLRNALDSLLRNTRINNNQKPSIGCNIKWK
jgi:thiol-disulfide isomerase/thioredoxin